MTFEKDSAERKTRKIVKIVVLFVIFAPLIVFVFGEIVLHLWNWLMPALFHLPTITYWQGLGLLVLSWLFFGGLRGSGPRSGYRRHWRRRMQDHWEHMSPEEREKFREWLQSHSQA
jgi:hypothetical protein